METSALLAPASRCPHGTRQLLLLNMVLVTTRAFAFTALHWGEPHELEPRFLKMQSRAVVLVVLRHTDV